jgi:tellurite methyltransferase
LQTPTDHDVKRLGNQMIDQGILHPDQLLLDYVSLFTQHKPGVPILDLASGEGHNGIFLATKGLVVILCDRSQKALRRAANLARKNHVRVKLWQVDLEEAGADPLPREAFAGILVFHYLHRPLIPGIKRSIEKGGILLYETFTTAQAQFGRPKNPDFLLNPGELYAWFQDWEVIHHFEGTLENPTRAISQIVGRKPNP